jgi:hypothetical protein
MPNQMIALQARNPQLPDPAQRTARMANMMNMARQQEAAQLQGERLRQEMEFARAGEERAAQTQTATMREKDQAFRVAGMKELRNRGVAILKSGSEPAYQLWLNQLDVVDPDSAAVAREIAPTLRKDAMEFFLYEADKFIDKNVATPTTETIFGPKNEILILTKGGGTGVAGLRPALNMPAEGADASPPRATPTAPQASAMERGPSAASDAPMTFGPDATRHLNAYQQEDLRNLEAELGMQDTPASFTRGGMGAPAAAPMTPERAQQIVDSAVRSRVMAQEDFDQLMAMAPEQNKQPFMDMIQANNITLQPGGMGQQPQFAVNQGQRPQADFAVNRGAPPPATLAQTNVIGQQAYGRSASPVSAAPAESPEQAGRRSLLGRETAGEVYAKEKARAKAQREAALEAGPKPLTPVQEARLRENISKDYKTAADTIATMLHPETGVIAAVQRVRNLTPSQKEWLTGYSTYAPSLTNAGKQADTRFGNLVGKVTAMGRALASLSGSIGPMAVQEWDIVRKQIAEIDPVKLSPESLDEELDLIEAQARGAAARIRDAYENQYVEEFARYPGRFQLSDPGSTPVKKKTAESQIPRIRGNADYNRLKPGAEFIDPNGVRRRKPK